jgi:hypothetical protein
MARGIEIKKKVSWRSTIATALPLVSSAWIDEAEKTIIRPISDRESALIAKI